MMGRWFWAWYFLLVFGGGLLVGELVAGRQDRIPLHTWLERPAPTVDDLQAYKAEHGEHWEYEMP